VEDSILLRIPLSLLHGDDGLVYCYNAARHPLVHGSKSNMRLLSKSLLLVSASMCLATALLSEMRVLAQQPGNTGEIIRTNTELVQSAVTVLDKSGHFVDGLRRDQFEILIDGKPRAVSFFDRITAGTSREKEVLSASNPTETAAPTAPTATVLGRSIVFFIDDLHLSADSMNRTRQMLRYFLERDMNSQDSVAIASASGQIGFLEQFTNNKTVLDAAIARLLPRPYDAGAQGIGNSTRMTEYMALAIDTSRSDIQVLSFYVEECMKGAVSKRTAYAAALMRAACTTQVKDVARMVLVQAAQITQNTYNSLESLMRSSARAPGRKLAFFVSDGFLMDAGPRAAGIRDKLDRVIDAARASGVVIYSIHAKGLVNSSYHDPANTQPMDSKGRLDLASVGELQANQDALNGLARDTGGSALRNTNSFEGWVSKALDETSNYYLLAWRPESDREKLPKFHNFQISVIGRPDLTVRAPRGYFDAPKPESIATKAPRAVPTQPDNEIRDALSDYYPASGVPLQLALTYLNTPANGLVLTSSIQINGSGISYGDDGKPATVRLAGVVLNDKGKVATSFKNEIEVNPPKPGVVDGGIFYTHHSPLSPGIYQVRVAARDEKSSRVGSAMQWVVVPDLSKGQLTSSSVLLDGQVLDNPKSTDSAPKIQLSVNHTFARKSQLSYWLFVYNAKRDGNGLPHLTIQTTVLRGSQPVLTSQYRRLDNSGPDPDRIPFGDQVALNTLAPGKYDLTVTIKDSVAGTSVTQKDYFIVR